LVGSIISIITILNFDFGDKTLQPLNNIDVKTLGHQMVGTGENGYALPFEVISILLLAALIGAVVIAKKEKAKTNTDK
jgi:NADH-quinone oxidoreductase subunit J